MTKAQACAAGVGGGSWCASTRPLCRRYALGMFDVALVRWRDAGGVRAHPVRWAFGWLEDGECEPLGVWAETGDGSADVPALLADLKRRGLERLRHVAAPDVGALRERLAAAFPAEGRLAPVEPNDVDSVAPSRRSVPASLERAADSLRDGVARAIRRQGSFADETAALDFVSGALQRTERRLDRERAMAQARPRHASGAPMAPPGF
jgi:hypothetical protein